MKRHILILLAAVINLGNLVMLKAQTPVNIYYPASDFAYANSIGSDFQTLQWKINKRYQSSAADTSGNFTCKWAAVRFDSLYDHNSSTGYPSATTSLRIDTIGLDVNHQKNTGGTDTLIISVLQRAGSASGFTSVDNGITVTNTVLWDTLIETTTSFTPGLALNQIGHLSIPCHLNIPAGINVIVKVDFTGDTTNHFYMFDYWRADCVPFDPNTSSASESIFPLNSWRYLNLFIPVSTDLNGLGGLVMASFPAGCDLYYFQNWGIAINATQIIPPLVASAGNDTTICVGGITLLNTSTSGGAPPYAYQWSTAENTVSINVAPVATTTYYLTVTDNLGATAVDSVTVFVNPTPVIDSVIVTDVSCFGGNDGSLTILGIGGTPAYEFSVSGALYQASNTFNNLSAGTYQAIVRDVNNCQSNIIQVNVFQPTQINVQLTASSDGIFPDTVCISSVSGGVAAYTYSYGGNFNQLPNNCFELLSGTFDVTVTDANNCTAITSSSCVGFQVDSFGTVDVSCFGGNDGSVCVYASGGTTPYLYNWSQNGTTQCVNGVAAGIYDITITDQNGCVASGTSMPVIQPTTIQSNLNVTDATCGQCNGEAFATVSGGSGPYTFQYFDVPPVSAKCTATFCDALCGGNQYLLLITDANGCTDSTFFTVGQQSSLQVDSLPTANVSCNGGNNGAICANISGGQMPYAYQWSNGEVTACIDSLPAGFYTVTVTDLNNCTITGTTSVTGQSALQIDSIVTTDVSCNGGWDGSACPLVSGGTLPYQYLWSTGHTTQCLVIDAGNHYLTVIDANGCFVEDTTTITEPAPLTAQFVYTSDGLIPDTVTCYVQGGTPPYSINWQDGHHTSNDTSTIVYTTDGIYFPEVTDSNGCMVTDTLVIGAGCAASCVWPGDANGNGIADNNDLLPIGLAYGTTGTDRIQQDIGWYPHPSLDWADTLASGVNYKHIDCNGDSIINSDDTLAIIQNFGQIHLKNNERKQWRANETALYVDLIPDTTFAGDTMYANLTLGDINIPATNVYGLAFTLNYNPIVVDSTKTQITFGNSWLGTATDKISIAKDLSQSGQLKCALTRIDKTTRSGFGQIGQASFIITTDNINGKDLIDYFAMEVWISDLVMIDNAGIIIPANEGADSTQIEFEPNSIRNQFLSIGTLTIQPNPANNEVWLSVSDNLLNAEMKLFDIEGRTLLTQTINTKNLQLNTTAFANGIYMVQVKNENGIITKRLAIAR